jgi:hypothetical protein
MVSTIQCERLPRRLGKSGVKSSGLAAGLLGHANKGKTFELTTLHRIVAMR